MNNANVIVVARGFQTGVLCVVVGAMLGCASADPTSGSKELRRAALTATHSQEMVDCLLPGQIRQLDETVTALSEGAVEVGVIQSREAFFSAIPDGRA